MTKSTTKLTQCTTCGTRYQCGKGCPVCADPHAQRRKIEKRNRRHGNA